MQLPERVRVVVERALEGIPLGELQKAAEALSARYRADQPAVRAHLADDVMARAYLAVRMPATYAAMRQAMAWTAEMMPEFAPETMLDAGSGPGTAMFAAADAWESLGEAVLLESAGAIRKQGERMVAEAAAVKVKWKEADLAHDLARTLELQEQADLVTCAYVLSELQQAARAQLVAELWRLTRSVLLVVEPGTPAGWQRILAARSQLVEARAHVVAPCAHAMRCPLEAPDWCHFARRVARSRMHRLSKQADVPWEDEKFIYLVVHRDAMSEAMAPRILTQPRVMNGLISVKLCNTDGTATQTQLRKRDAMYKVARRADWGDRLTLTSEPEAFDSE